MQPLRSGWKAALMGVALIVLVAAPARGEPRENHPWARFDVGAWKQVRLFKETFDAQGSVTGTSTTETRTTVVEIDDQVVKLRIDVTVEVAGRRFTAEPRDVKLGWNGDSTAQIKELGETQYELDVQQIPCTMREVTVKEEGKVRVSKEFVRDNALPRILKRTEVVKNDAGETQYETLSYVTALEMPHKILADIKPCWHVKTVLDQGKSTTITHEVHAADVPGGVVAQSNKVLNGDGHMTERSTLELVDYGVAPRPEVPTMGRRGLFKSKRSRRQ